MLYTSDSGADVMDRIPAGAWPEVGVASDVRRERQGEASVAQHIAEQTTPYIVQLIVLTQI